MTLQIPTVDDRLAKIKEINSLLSEGRKLFIWGNGEYAKAINSYLAENGINAEAAMVVDDEFYCNEGNAIPFSLLLEMASIDPVIVFGFYNYKIIQQKRARWASAFAHMYDFHLTVVNGVRLRWDVETALHHADGFIHTFNTLSDDKSRNTMKLYLNAAVGGQFDPLFEQCYVEPAYFNEVTSSLLVDTLVDCGAYDGDSIHDFISVFPDYESIFAFEPDSQNVDKIRKRVKDEGIRNLTLYECGVYSHNGMLGFMSNGESNSFVSTDSDSFVNVMRLDELGDLIGSKALIKMDIEGSELEALRGAASVIKSKHPALTICVYHKESDLVDIPSYIEQLVGEGVYDFYLRFHGLDLAELCFYAIPKSTFCVHQ